MGSDIKIAIDGADMGAYVARPQTPNGGGVVVLQEIFGVNRNIRAIVDKFAGEGYVCVAPDLFWRQEPGVQLDPAAAGAYERATHLMKGLDRPKAIQDAHAAVKWLNAQPDVTGKVGVVGYCLGGNLSFQLSGRDGIAASVSYYGTGIHTVLDAVSESLGDTLLHVAESDHLCPPEAQDAIKNAVAGNEHVKLILYPGAGHAFARIGGDHYDQAAAEKADRATTSFFAKRLPARRA